MTKEPEKKNDKKDDKTQVPEKVKAPTKRELCVHYHKEGLSTREIAEKAGTTLNSARWYLSKEGLKSYPDPKIIELREQKRKALDKLRDEAKKIRENALKMMTESKNKK